MVLYSKFKFSFVTCLSYLIVLRSTTCYPSSPTQIFPRNKVSSLKQNSSCGEDLILNSEYNNNSKDCTLKKKMVSSVAEMKRGHNGRLEEAFATAKEKGESAFITFITAGYPRAQG